MVILNKIYTRAGDDGSTALATGDRRPKHDLRVAAYGTVDEANATIGLARLATSQDPALDEVDAILARLQNDLFDLGADLCTPDTGRDLGWEPLRISTAQVERLEGEIDRLNADLKALRSFVLPGGSSASAHLHLARTVMRRAERLMVELARREGEPVSEPAIKFANRASDLLFVAARWANDKGDGDVLWVKGQNR